MSYFGGRHSKSTVLGTGLALMAFGSLLFTMPHMIAEPYTNTYHTESTGLSKCNPSSATASNRTAEASAKVDESTIEFDALRGCPSPENTPGSFRYVFLFCLAQ